MVNSACSHNIGWKQNEQHHHSGDRCPAANTWDNQSRRQRKLRQPRQSDGYVRAGNHSGDDRFETRALGLNEMCRAGAEEHYGHTRGRRPGPRRPSTRTMYAAPREQGGAETYDCSGEEEWEEEDHRNSDLDVV